MAADQWVNTSRETYVKVVKQHEKTKRSIKGYEVGVVGSYNEAGEYIALAFYQRNLNPIYRVKKSCLSNPKPS